MGGEGCCKQQMQVRVDLTPQHVLCPVRSLWCIFKFTNLCVFKTCMRLFQNTKKGVNLLQKLS